MSPLGALKELGDDDNGLDDLVVSALAWDLMDRKLCKGTCHDGDPMWDGGLGLLPKTGRVELKLVDRRPIVRMW